MSPQKPLDEYTEQELREAYRNCVRHVEYSANNYREELFRRSQDRAAAAMNRWTRVIGAATLVNVLIVLWQILRSINHS
jgi:hypothetical protein